MDPNSLDPKPEDLERFAEQLLTLLLGGIPDNNHAHVSKHLHVRTVKIPAWVADFVTSRGGNPKAEVQTCDICSHMLDETIHGPHVFPKPKRCQSKCPTCGKQCAGLADHGSEHSCCDPSTDTDHIRCYWTDQDTLEKNGPVMN